MGPSSSDWHNMPISEKMLGRHIFSSFLALPLKIFMRGLQPADQIDELVGPPDHDIVVEGDEQRRHNGESEQAHGDVAGGLEGGEETSVKRMECHAGYGKSGGEWAE